MKIFLSIALIAFVMMGCSKDDDDSNDDNNNDPTTEGTMQIDVDGTTWTAETVTAAAALDLITLGGIESGSDQQLIFLLPDDITTGTYDLDNGPLGALAITYVSVDNIPLYPTSGTLEITKHNTTTNEFEGTFSFEASDMMNSTTASITNGSFDVNYIE